MTEIPESMSRREERLYELDILRVLGTFAIVFHHLPDYAGDFYDLNRFGIPLKLSYINVLNTYFGLGIFVFVSGFTLYYTNPKVDNILLFLKKRVIRIFPLYLVALVLFTLTLRRLSLSETLIHILGLQILLAPRFVVPMPTLWFIGLIVILYLFYAFRSKYTSSGSGTVLFSLLVFGLLLVIRSIFGIVEYRFFIYFPVFWAGVLCCRNRLFSRYDFGVAHIVVAVLVLCMSVLVFRYSHQGPNTGEITEESISQASTTEILIASIASDIIMLSAILIAFIVVKHVRKYLNETATRLLSFASFSSYCVYLFHRPALYAVAKAVYPYSPADDFWRLCSFVVVGLPLIFVLSYVAQALYNRIARRVS